jgi:hypothetical protein
MHRRLLLILSALAMSVAMATSAVAQNPHFVRGPAATDQGTTLNVTGSIAGLGGADGDAVVTVVAQGSVSVDCVNPGGNPAPGQRTEATLTGTDTVTASRSGRVNFNVTTTEPTAPDPAVVCPNPRWSTRITDVQFTSYTVSVTQRGVTYNLGSFPV